MSASRWEKGLYLIGLFYIATLIFSEDQALVAGALIALATAGDIRLAGD